MHCVVSFLLSYILRDVSFTEVVSVCRVALREPIHLYTCVSKEGVNGETPRPETPSLLSYTLSIHQFHRGRQHLPGFVARTDAPVYMREQFVTKFNGDGVEHSHTEKRRVEGQSSEDTKKVSFMSQQSKTSLSSP